MQHGGITRGLVALLVLACVSVELHAAVPTAVAEALRARAASKGEVRLIVQVADPGDQFAKLPPAARQAREQQIARLQDHLASRAQQPGMREVVRFRTIPFMVFTANADAVAKLASLPEVLSLQEDIPEYPTLASSIPIVGAGTAWAAGFDGTGQVIAVLDTGVDTTHPYFPPAKLVAEACFSTNSVADKSQSVCPGQASSSTAAGSGKNCPTNILGCSHGTHVAGIAVGNRGTGPNTGVAKGAKLIPIQVFSCISSSSNCTGTASAGSYPSDQILALEHLLLLSSSIDIAAVNMSLGSSLAFTSQGDCDLGNAARKAALDNLRAVGIATIVASGNGSRRDALSQPGCISTVISVGNTTDADAIASTSNVASFLDLLAPGSEITSAFPGGSEVTESGTSMAAPHVAGAWAVLRQAQPEATVDELLAALRLTATVVNDQRPAENPPPPGRVLPAGSVTDMRRINLDLALGSLTAPQPEIETNPVAGSVLDLGDVAFAAMGAEFDLEVTNSGEEELTLSCGISGAQSSHFSMIACPAAVVATASVDISLRCEPLAVGELSATLTVTSNDSSEPTLNYMLQCTGLGVEIGTQPVAGSALTFGGVLFNTNSPDLSVQVNNIGNQSLSLSCGIVGTDPEQFAISACPATVTGGEQTLVSVRCEPDSQGSFSADLQISSNDPDENLLSFPLSCYGLAPEIASDPAPGSELDFGTSRAGEDNSVQFISLSNVGDGELQLSCAVVGSAPESFSVINCPASIAAGNQVNLELRCNPGSIGELDAQLQITSNDEDEALLNFDLKCLGLPPENVFTDSFEQNQ